MHSHAARDQDYERERERDSVLKPTYKVMESRAGDIRGRAALTAVNKITAQNGFVGGAAAGGRLASVATAVAMAAGRLQ